MAETESHHGSNHPNVPPGSAWPLVAGLLAMVAGAILIWWINDRENILPGIAAGALFALSITSLLVWALYEVRDRPVPPRDDSSPTSDLVLSFAMQDGRLDAERTDGGILRAFDNIEPDRTEGLRDVRVMVAPADSGPAQVLVEGVWSEHAQPASVEQLRERLKSILDEHDEVVVPGSVRWLTMSVLRDTRDVASHMQVYKGVGVVAAMAVAGFLIGGFLTFFQVEDMADGGIPATATPTGEFTGTILEQNIRFIPTEFTVPSNTEVTLVEDNQDTGVPHNIRIYQGEAYEGPPITGCVAGCDTDEVVTPVRMGVLQSEFTFVTPDPGRYAYWCDIHPTTMRGVMMVEEGAPVPTDRLPENSD